MARTILVLGPSGRGKSFSLRNLPEKFTLIMNHERKTLPFKGHAKFNEKRPLNVQDTFKALDEALADKNVRILVIESLSAFLEMQLAEARVLKKGWDVFTLYNERLYSLFERIRQFNDAGKHVIVISHDEIDDNELTGDIHVSAKVKGKEWKGAVEKEFDIVLHAEMEVDENKVPHYKFRTQTDGVVPAKAPFEMFDSIMIENDMAKVLKAVSVYDKP
jgi:hypothetical protein